MKILLNEDEITQAIETQVRSQISINDDQEISVDFKGGRGDNCMEAIIDIRARTFKHVAKPKGPIQRRANVADAPSAVATAANHVAARVAEDLAQADEEDTTTNTLAGITATPEDRQPPVVEPTGSLRASIFGAKPAVVAVNEVTSVGETDDIPFDAADEPVVAEVEPAPVTKPKSIFSITPKAEFAA